jgi:ABC-type uncharacterized transport system involved in gliding motility auxiliary subunit
MHPSQLNPPNAPTDSELDKLLNAWGVTMVPKVVAGDREAARKVNAGTDEHVVPVDYVAWLTLPKQDLNPNDPITGDLSQITMATAGVLEPRAGAKTTFTPLISTSTNSEEIPVAKVQGTPDIEALLHDFKPDGKRLVLAARVTGPADTAFPNGLPKPPGDKTKPAAADAKKPAASEPAEVKIAVKPINVVVVADTDMLADRFWVDSQDFVGQHVAVPIANNGDLVTNAIDTLSGGDDLIGLRTRGTAVRPFTLVQNIQRVADERYQDTEKGLEKKLKETQDKIKQASGHDPQSSGGQAAGDSSNAALEQAQTLDSFRTELLKVRRQLREVQLALRQDIDRVRAEIEFADIAAIPILVALVAIVLGILRMNRRRRRAQTG